MKPNPKFENLPLDFWANVKLLNQKLGYTVRSSKHNQAGGFIVPTIKDIINVFREEELSNKQLIENNIQLTDYGKLVVEYMEYRGAILQNYVRLNLMNKEQAKALFESVKQDLNPSCPIPLNKQKGDKRDFSFLTGIVNMLIESNIGKLSCDYDPRELTSITHNGYPVRTLSRRVDGAFPGTKDPIAIWEIKEYYYTTTFGSRVADGVYETQLDGWELWEARTNLGRDIKHYLFVDDYFTWWDCGRSYLCRLIDSIHMGLVSEVIFGRETIERIPEIVDEWRNSLK